MRKNLLFILLQSVLLCSAVLAEPVSQQDERLEQSCGQPEVSTVPLLDTFDGDTDSVLPRCAALFSATPNSWVGKPLPALGLALSPLRDGHAIRAPPFRA